MSVDPATLVGDDWMHDPVARARFETLLNEQDEVLKPLTDALKASVRLTAEDLSTMVG